ncbi:pyrroline-5-carboxylate reductase [Gracilibacillus ureilyticus]|uniref:Pyrroline-5-carboxylate reductase n=1 Tax=Gracilibacillus ureilyticus TaxID=531814 RepID=A0A1H9V059_9BACI|nr:pyrroline-5-carboxylate reductase [Gracilibacillus ureilyticus]SES15052.1 pyrroline-5-carboxylate reductase [Gracilibacillus ureilyticus]
MEQIITFLGAGSMAEAIIAGMTANNIVPAKQIIATNHSNKERLKELAEKYQIQTTSNKQEAVSKSDVIILAMKPKDIRKATDEIKSWLNKDKVIVSLLAGISTTFIENQLNESNPVIRVMPNTSATIGLSATTITGGQFATEENMKLVETLIQSVGTTEIIKEDEMDAFTAIAGSGPAFYYYMLEAMEQFVHEKGLDMEIAKPLIVQTIKGVAEMLNTSPDSTKTLREKITSPGGTTEAGLKALADHEFQQAVIACLHKATDKSAELRKNFEK